MYPQSIVKHDNLGHNMNENVEGTKSKDARVEEKEKLLAETERSIAAARMKEAHKLIEDTEKLRKRSAVLSLRSRLLNLGDLISKYAGSLLQKGAGFFDMTPWESMCDYVKNFEKRYESVRYDLQKTLEIKSEDFEKLFPKLEVNMKCIDTLTSSLVSVAGQLVDMVIYCDRMLS
jgi:hypothetical protein